MPHGSRPCQVTKYSYTATYPIQSLRDLTDSLSIFFDQHGLGFNIADQLVFIDIGDLDLMENAGLCVTLDVNDIIYLW